MKVGEAGEAFFVFETDDDIPDDLITSPLLEATQTAAETHADVPTGKFGTEQGQGGDVDQDRLPEEAAQEPEYLDLDAESKESKDQPIVPSTEPPKLHQGLFAEAINSLPSPPPSPTLSGITPSSLLAAVGTKLDPLRKVDQFMHSNQGEGRTPEVSYQPGEIQAFFILWGRLSNISPFMRCCLGCRGISFRRSSKGIFGPDVYL
jgi:hypothetical protein